MKDHKLLNMLPAIFAQSSTVLQARLVFYYFEISFIRAGILLFGGFLAFRLIAQAFSQQQIMQLLTYPISRTQIYGGIMLTIMLIIGLILIIFHGVSLLIIQRELRQQNFAIFRLFLTKDWFLDSLFIISGLIPTMIALFKPHVGYVTSSALILIIILCNAAVASYRPENMSWLFIIL
ncbi:hypothetical protein EQ500_11350, partial [Lactobacillus sp. XV13L]|nr:hypothetical protein [Lactobacillus sp. XV13L]